MHNTPHRLNRTDRDADTPPTWTVTLYDPDATTDDDDDGPLIDPYNDDEDSDTTSVKPTHETDRSIHDDMSTSDDDNDHNDATTPPSVQHTTQLQPRQLARLLLPAPLGSARHPQGEAGKTDSSSGVDDDDDTKTARALKCSAPLLRAPAPLPARCSIPWPMSDTM